ncbi:MAG: hypothetical protein WD877_01025 [Candidatus Saccharimonadales bacterium]
MNLARKNRLALVSFCLLLTLAPVSVVYGAKPYLKVFGGDVMSGGWFNAGSSCNTAAGSSYQDPNYQLVGDVRNGGILAFSKEGPNGVSAGGASSQYGAFSLGQIEGNSGPQYGFYSGSAQSANGPTSKKYLSFANDDEAKAPWGGFYEGDVRQSACLPDYWTKLANANASGLSVLGSLTPSGAYSASASGSNPFVVNNSPVNLSAGKKITLFVNGNAYIGNNITYGPSNANNLPKFALVVKGSLYIDPAVTQLDGVYIAQPAGNIVTADDGNIWTCHPNNSLPVYDDYPATCTNQLVVNGALLAKQINFLRAKGDVATATTAEDDLSPAMASDNIAEIINYTPAMVIGGPFFNQATAPTLKVQSLQSLPPVF